jgi:anti-anti-sigma factor
MPPKPHLADSIVDHARARPPAFECSWVNGGFEAAWVSVAGELDIATTPQLERALREAQVQARLVVLDLRELAFIDNFGVHAIVNAGIRARQVGHRLFLLRGSSGDVLNGDIRSAEPSVEALAHVVEAELAP